MNRQEIGIGIITGVKRLTLLILDDIYEEWGYIKGSYFWNVFAIYWVKRVRRN